MYVLGGGRGTPFSLKYPWRCASWRGSFHPSPTIARQSLLGRLQKPQLPAPYFDLWQLYWGPRRHFKVPGWGDPFNPGHQLLWKEGSDDTKGNLTGLEGSVRGLEPGSLGVEVWGQFHGAPGTWWGPEGLTGPPCYPL